MKQVSLAAELSVLRRAVEGVIDLLDVETFEDAPDRRRRAAAARVLVAERVRLLRRAVVGAVDPGEVLGGPNEVEAWRGDDPDLLLVPLSPTSPTPPRPAFTRRKAK